MTARVRILLVDDSPIFAAAVKEAAAGHPRVEIVGVASDGAEALDLVRRLRPDVVSMDVHMPKVDGVEAVRRLMEVAPTPIAMVTGADSSQLADISFRAIGAGALDVLRKPSGPTETAALLSRLALLAGVTVHARPARVPVSTPVRAAPSGSAAPPSDLAALEAAPGRTLAVGVAISTGGPPVLEAAFSALPHDYPAPILVVQHLSAGFDVHLAQWLARTSGVPVAVAGGGQRAEPGRVYLAPYDGHLEVGMGGYLRIDQAGERVDGHRPSGTALLKSLARVYGSRAAGIVLTGMGSDGAAGLLALRQAGGITAAQDAASSVVDGMPRSARDQGAAEWVVSGGDVARFLLRAVGRR